MKRNVLIYLVGVLCILLVVVVPASATTVLPKVWFFQPGNSAKVGGSNAGDVNSAYYTGNEGFVISQKPGTDMYLYSPMMVPYKDDKVKQVVIGFNTNSFSEHIGWITLYDNTTIVESFQEPAFGAWSGTTEVTLTLATPHKFTYGLNIEMLVWNQDSVNHLFNLYYTGYKTK